MSSRASRIAGALPLAILTVVTVVPFTPVMPAAHLDPSWAFAINEAVAQRLVFGTSLIFSFGPYASVYTQLYHPATDALMLLASVFLALAVWAALAVVAADGRRRAAFVFALVALAFRWERDVQLFLPVLLAALTAHGRLLSRVDEPAWWRTAALVVTFAALGLLPLVKGSALVLCAAVIGLAVVCGLVAGRPAMSAVCLVSPVAAMLGFWTLAGQPPRALVGYLASLTALSAAYADAMSIRGATSGVVWYLVASVAILAVTVSQRQWPRPVTAFTAGSLAAFLFVMFKAGFVRHDFHALIAGCGVVVAALSLPLIVRSNVALWAVACAIVPWAIVDRHVAATSPPVLVFRMASAVASAGGGLARRVSDPGWPQRDYEAARAALATRAGFPVLGGTTDIYSYNQSYLLASGNTWAPRPVLQSYAAFTPTLAEANRMHLLGDRAPDHVILNVEPIDGHLPALEDGASWPVLMARYRPVQSVNGFLVLSRRPDAGDVLPRRETNPVTHQFGEPVPVPSSGEPTWVRIEIAPTLLGRVASVLFKSSELNVQLELVTGERRQYRLIPGMAAAGFLLSPLVDTTAEFGALVDEPTRLGSKVVRSMTVGSVNGAAFWNPGYRVRWGQ